MRAKVTKERAVWGWRVIDDDEDTIPGINTDFHDSPSARWEDRTPFFRCEVNTVVEGRPIRKGVEASSIPTRNRIVIEGSKLRKVIQGVERGFYDRKPRNL
jgi:hypothetical protein